MQVLVEISGKQFIAEQGMTIKVPSQSGKEGDSLSYDKVLYVSNDKDKVFGSPYVKNASVEAELVSHGRDRKIIVFKFIFILFCRFLRQSFFCFSFQSTLYRFFNIMYYFRFKTTRKMNNCINLSNMR